MKHREVAVSLAVALAILGALALFAWRYLVDVPNTGRNIFGDEAAFRAYVSGLGLASMAPGAARDRLMLEGFRCELFADGTSSCHRRAQGSQCGEQQFVDLPAPGTGAAVATRFGLSCR
ncbi:MAG TPA: hypothetical protein VHA15_11360 [Burkholderiales bacterium]|nr:hypothetical protein [Burkholderiales bacterium]